MSPHTHLHTPAILGRSATGSRRGAHEAFLLLRTVFTIAPIAFGLDKFFGVLVDWDVYLAPWINDIVPGTAHEAMLLVGVVEIAAGVLVTVAPRLGGYVVALWLTGIIVNLLTLGDYFDIALRDFGLLVGALALARLATPDAAEANLGRRHRPGLGFDRAGRTDRHRRRRPGRRQRRGRLREAGTTTRSSSSPRNRRSRTSARRCRRATSRARRGASPRTSGRRSGTTSTTSTSGSGTGRQHRPRRAPCAPSGGATTASAGCCSPPAPGHACSTSPPTDAIDVRYLRTLADSTVLRERLVPASSPVIVGGGWIGMEVAATARHARHHGRRWWSRPSSPCSAALGPEVGQPVRRGTPVRTAWTCGRDRARAARGRRRPCSATAPGSSRTPCSSASVRSPNVELAAAAGLTVDNGVLVDAGLRTSHPAVFAAGDVANARPPASWARGSASSTGRTRSARGGPSPTPCSASQSPTTRCRTSSATSTTSAWSSSATRRAPSTSRSSRARATTPSPAGGTATAGLVAAMHVNQWDRSDELRERVAQGA